ncbi:uncharacterized protein LOC120623912 [Pararge aegeria]|uniref:uncharacterized protein LOC120623912 n=1 Tax=Pararge aegeria TaxID=116150 RepID=UPI0019D1A7BE|nr:uncharacterized protein LOC120623912 [Pararge aegeria]
MDQVMTKEESYAERRQLFKDIWKTSMNMADQEDIMTKPKVIKTLRLSEMDRCVAKKKKKQKLKNLRAVCNQLLDFCDRQDTDDFFYEQMATAGGKTPSTPSDTVEPKIKKKPVKIKKKINKTKILLCAPAIHVGTTTATISHRNDLLPINISRNTSPMKVKQPYISFASSNLSKTNPTHSNIVRRTVKKSRSKKKEISLNMPKVIMNGEI